MVHVIYCDTVEVTYRENKPFLSPSPEPFPNKHTFAVFLAPNVLMLIIKVPY